MADSMRIPRHTLHIPEIGQDTYLAETKALRMWRSVPRAEYPVARVSSLIAAARVNRHNFYSKRLRTLESYALSNFPY